METVGIIKVLIIDEIFMVGPDMLLTVHRSLCDVMGNHQSFGGISVLGVGDLLQLPPLAKNAVFRRIKEFFNSSDILVY